jgi:hypothetical protein
MRTILLQIENLTKNPIHTEDLIKSFQVSTQNAKSEKDAKFKKEHVAGNIR